MIQRRSTQVVRIDTGTMLAPLAARAAGDFMSIGSRALVQRAGISVSTLGDNTIVAASSGKLITVVGLLLMNNVATAQSVIVKDGATALTGAMALSTSGNPLVLPDNGSGNFDWFSTSNPANNLVLNLSAATAVGGVVWYIQQ